MTAEIHLRFYEELNDYLPGEKRKREFAFQINGQATILDVLREFGVPESEVELVLLNGSSAELSSFLQAGDRVSIYPVFESLDVKPLLKIRPEPLRKTRFVADSSLSCLVSFLRGLGFDAVVESRIHAAGIAESEARILLTTDPEFLNSGLSRVHLIREADPREQLNEVLARFHLTDSDWR